MSDFDPKAYAEAAGEPAFDPAAYASAQTPPVTQPKVGVGETFLNSSTNALPLGKQLVDMISTGAFLAGKPKAGATLTPQAIAEMKRLGIAVPGEESSGLLETYRKIRDTREGRTAAGESQNPITAAVGKGTGVALSLAAPLPKVTVGSGVPGRIVSNMATGGVYGGINSAAGSSADLSKGEILKTLSDAVGVEGLEKVANDISAGKYGHAALEMLGSGVVGGAVTAGVLSSALEAGRAALSGAAPAVRGASISAGRRVLTNGADSLSTREPVAESAVQEAINSGAIKPLGSTAGTSERLRGLTKEVGGQYSDILEKLEANGVTGPRADAIANKILAKGAEIEPGEMSDSVVNEYLNNAEKISGKAPGGAELGLTQGEKLKRSLQRQAKYDRVSETGVNEARRDVASIIRQANEDAVSAAGDAAGEGSQTKALAGQFTPVKARLSNLIEAREAARRGAARVAQRSHFGPMEIAAGAAEVAAGHPATALPAAIAMKLVRGRGPSTTAAYGSRLADWLENPGAATGTTGLAAEQTAALISSLRRKGIDVVDIPTPHLGTP